MSGVESGSGSGGRSGNGGGKGRRSIFAPRPSRAVDAGRRREATAPSPAPHSPHSPATATATATATALRDSASLPIFSAFARHAAHSHSPSHALRHALARFYPAAAHTSPVDIPRWHPPVSWTRVNPAIERAERERQANERERELKEALEARKAAEKQAKLQTQGKFGIVLPPGLRVPAAFKTEAFVKSEPSSLPGKSEDTSLTLSVPDPPAQTTAPRPRKQGALYTPRPPSPTDPRTSNPTKVSQWLSRMSHPRRTAVIRGFPLHTSDSKSTNATLWSGELVGGTAIVPGVTGQPQLTGPRSDHLDAGVDAGVDADGGDKPQLGRPDPPTHFAIVMSGDKKSCTVVPVYGTYAFKPRRSAVSAAGFAVKKERGRTGGGGGSGGARIDIKRESGRSTSTSMSTFTSRSASGEFAGLLGANHVNIKPDPDAGAHAHAHSHSHPDADRDADADADADQLVLQYLGKSARRGAPTRFALLRAGLDPSVTSKTTTSSTSARTPDSRGLGRHHPSRRARADVADADEDADFAALDNRSDDEEYMGGEGEGEDEWYGSGAMRKEGEERERDRVRLQMRGRGGGDGLFGSDTDSEVDEGTGKGKHAKFSKDGKRLAKRLKRNRAKDRQTRSGEPSSDEDEDQGVGGDWASAFLKSKGVGVESDSDSDGDLRRKKSSKDDMLTDIGAGREELKRREREARKNAKEAEKARTAATQPAGPRWSGPTSGGGLGGAARVAITGTGSGSSMGTSPPAQGLASPGTAWRAPSPLVPRGPSPPTSRATSPPIPRPGTPSRGGWSSPGLSRPTSPKLRAGSPLARPPTPGRATAMSTSTPVTATTSSRGPSPISRGPSPVMRATSPRRPGSPPQSPPYLPGSKRAAGSEGEVVAAGRGKKRKVDALTGGASGDGTPGGGGSGGAGRKQEDLASVVEMPDQDGPLTDADLITAISLQPGGACTARQLLHALRQRMSRRPDSKDVMAEILKRVAVGKKEAGVMVFRVKGTGA